MATDLKEPADTQGITLKGSGTVNASLGPFGGMYDNPPESSSGALLKKEKKDKDLELPGKDEDIKEVKHL